MSTLRSIKYLSPSALNVWLDNKEEYYLRYLSPNPPPRTRQTKPMAVGSAFDAYVKAYLHKRLFGPTPEYAFQTLFEKQVEEHVRDWAIGAGAECFKAYRAGGSLNELLRVLEVADGEPKMEFAETRTFTNGLTLLGKPDLYFRTKGGLDVVHDWKVTGYCSTSSPTAGYIMVRGANRNAGRHHDNCCIWQESDVTINAVCNVEKYKPAWGRQLSCYAWITGANVGQQVICSVDEITNRNGLSIAHHRCEISEEFQKVSFAMFSECWNVVHSDHIFRNMSKEESEQRCQMLDQQAELYQDPMIRRMLGKE